MALLNWLKNNEAVKKVCGILGIIEGVIYIILCLVAILVFFVAERPERNTEDINDIPINWCIYMYFFDRNIPDVIRIEQSFTPTSFHAFVWVHLFINIVWTIVSGFVLNKDKGDKKSTLMAWLVTVTILCIWELITSALVISDYDKCISTIKKVNDFIASSDDNQPSSPLPYSTCHKQFLPVLVPASKCFFVLWTINGFLACIMFMTIRSMNEEL